MTRLSPEQLREEQARTLAMQPVRYESIHLFQLRIGHR